MRKLRARREAAKAAAVEPVYEKPPVRNWDLKEEPNVDEVEKKTYEMVISPVEEVKKPQVRKKTSTSKTQRRTRRSWSRNKSTNE